MFFWRRKYKIIPIVFPQPKKIIEGKDCPICLKELEYSQVFLPCGHTFHGDCILDWIDRKKNCPICRFPLQWTLLNANR